VKFAQLVIAGLDPAIHLVSPSFRGASEASEPGIHNHDWGLWIPGMRQGAHPGMTTF
jgi:hypothetical protein